MGRRGQRAARVKEGFAVRGAAFARQSLLPAGRASNYQWAYTCQ